MRKILLSIIIAAFSSAAFSQTVVMSNGAGSCSCQGLFLDPGGISDYPQNQDMTYVLSPSDNENLVGLEFTDFDIEKLNDYLLIYDGNTTSSPLIGRFNNASPPKGIIHASAANPSGSLTLVFHSGSSTTFFRGWKAQINCISRQSEINSSAAAHYFFKISGLQSPEDAMQIDQAVKLKNGVLKCETNFENGIMSIEAEPVISAEKMREMIMSTWKITGKVITAEKVENNSNQ